MHKQHWHLLAHIWQTATCLGLCRGCWQDCGQNEYEYGLGRTQLDLHEWSLPFGVEDTPRDVYVLADKQYLECIIGTIGQRYAGVDSAVILVGLKRFGMKLDFGALGP